MHKFMILSLTFTGLMADASAATIPAGSEVHLRTTAAISSRDAQVSDRVEFRVDEDVTAGKVIVIPKGSLAWGAVADAAPRGRMGRSGRLAVDIQSVCLADGGAAPLRGSDPRGAERKHRAKSEGAADAMA